MTAAPVIPQLSATDAWLERDADVLAPTLARVHDVVVESGSGSWLTDVDGHRWLDLTSGIGVTNVGHCHPRVVAAAEAQLRRLVHTSVVAHHQPAIALAEALASRCAGLFAAPQVFFANSGAEAVDGAVKLARHVTGRPGIVAFRGGFHGRTIAATSLTTAKTKYRARYEPLIAGITVAPYAYPLRYGGDAAATEACLAQLDELFAMQTPPDDVAAMIVEPVLGEGGYVPPPAAWLAGLRERCDRHGILLVLDEVQSGAGRTGALFAASTYGVRPDVVLFAKGIASGLPLSGLIADASTFSRWPPGSHGSTFGGNPVSCAAGLATLQVLDEEDLYARARTLGARLVRVLREATSGDDRVLEVRGLGLMVGVELDTATRAAAVQRHCRDLGVLVLTCGPADNVLRLIPPLTITDGEVDLALEALTTSLVATRSDR